ncbi:hypothetical protein FA13DRAFT_1258885 [Coprinellus micaceus]|uniref:CAP-Gly domain-containing protein n=1 Tax=Coprinellus micaceus TaxID=71717 RepID=A0A4Y7TRB9_COPMI|nr:hypothetical protein FA13DRAFT_1258885 [Coprinellus micaceus]
MMDSPRVGARIKYSGFNGTIRYVGPVENANGTWLGVEWDDPRRGKHDGSKDGRRYFSCRSACAGSFVRANSHVQYGMPFLQALSEKYVEEPHGNDAHEIVVLGSVGNVQVEAVGLDKVRSRLSRLDRLKVVSLDGTLVAFPDTRGKIRETCPNIRDLDLSFTLVSSWASVAHIASELPLLQRLSLNRLRLFSLERDGAFSSAFLNLTEIQLNGTLLSWPEVNGIITQMPALRGLEMGYNHLSSLSTGGGSDPRGPHPTLQTLNLENNELAEWTIIASSICIMPSVETLNVSSNGVKSIQPPVEALSLWCPKLKNLSVSDIPLNSHPQSRSLIIARFPNLVTLDGTLISERERRDSEMLYLTQLAREGIVGMAPNSTPFRWEELCKLHGPPGEEVKPKDDNLSSRLITVYTVFGDVPPVGRAVAQSGDSVPLSILPTMPLRTLRNKLKKTHGKGRGTVQVWIKMRDGTWAELGQGDDSNSLDWLGIENDSHILYRLKTS